MDWGLAKVLPRGGRRRRRPGRQDRSPGDASSRRPGAAPTVRALARRLGDGHAGLHGARAGPRRGRPGRRAGRRVRAGLDPLRDLTGEPAFLGRSAGEIQRKAALGDLADAMARLESLRGRRRADRAGAGLPGARAGGPAADAGAVAERITAYLAGVQERLRAAEIARAAEARTGRRGRRACAAPSAGRGGFNWGWRRRCCR